MTFFMGGGGGGGGAKSQAKQKVSTIPLKSLKLMNDYKAKKLKIMLVKWLSGLKSSNVKW